MRPSFTLRLPQPAAHGWAVSALTLACLLPAHAQTSGTLLGRLGITRIAPSVQSGDLTTPSFPNTQIDVKANSQLTAGLTWVHDAHWAWDIPLSTGFQHDIVGDGAIKGVGKIGQTKALPITLLAQYRFGEAGDAVRPFIGLGPTYARFYKERSTAALTGLTGGSAEDPTTLSIASRWGLTLQLGASVPLASGWWLDATVLKTALKTRATLSTGQTIDVSLNPWVYSVGIVRPF